MYNTRYLDTSSTYPHAHDSDSSSPPSSPHFDPPDVGKPAGRSVSSAIPKARGNVTHGVENGQDVSPATVSQPHHCRRRCHHRRHHHHIPTQLLTMSCTQIYRHDPKPQRSPSSNWAQTRKHSSRCAQSLGSFFSHSACPLKPTIPKHPESSSVNYKVRIR
jgi:hypothetical protein